MLGLREGEGGDFGGQRGDGMKERGILFSAPMVRALLAGTKTQTRRVIARPLQHPGWTEYVYFGPSKNNPACPSMAIECGPDYPDGAEDKVMCPYGQPGDRLWVRETWAKPAALDPGPTVYRADYPACVPPEFENLPAVDEITWKPSIHMFRRDSRILLEIVSVRVERLNDCSAEDARAEGIICPLFPKDGGPKSWTLAYEKLWEKINGTGSWAANPWIWVVEFKKLENANGND